MAVLVTRVVKGEKEKDLQFPFILKVTNLPLGCDTLRWEQFIRGSFVLFFADGTAGRVFAKETVLNKSAKTYGDWIEDLRKDMPSGPKLLKAYEWAKCSWPARGRGIYEFSDSPGFENEFGDEREWRGLKKMLIGVEWGVDFEHKLWAAGQTGPFYVVNFQLRGIHRKKLNPADRTRTSLLTENTLRIVGIAARENLSLTWAKLPPIRGF